MKRLSIILILISTIKTFAQLAPPQAFSYSGVARDAQNNPIATQAIGVQFSILQSSTTGPIIYRENHLTNTDAAGLFTLNIGTGSVQQGVFNTIDWGADNYYLQLGLDPFGGTNFQNIGITQFLTVPYALYAKNSGYSIFDNDTSSTNELQTLNLNGNILSISNGNSVTIPSGSLTTQLEIPQQIPFYNLTLDPGSIRALTSTTDGSVVILALSNNGNINHNTTWLLRMERSNSGIYIPTHSTSPLSFKTNGMVIIDSFIYVNANSASIASVIKRYKLSDISFDNDMTYNPSAPQNAQGLFTDGSRLFVSSFINMTNRWETFNITSTALINSNQVFSFDYNGETSVFKNEFVFDGSYYYTYVSGPINNRIEKLLKYDLNRNLVSDVQISDPGSFTNFSSSKLIKISSINIGAKYNTTGTLEKYPVINTQTFNKP